MKINELYKKKFVISFEIFPPKTAAGEEKLNYELGLLSASSPDFVSITYGAGGSTRDKTLELALSIRDKYGITPITHFTCVGAGKDDIRLYVEEVKQSGINNILALRGDPPAGEASFKAHPEGFKHADELIRFIRSMEGFTIAAAGYPEVHTEAVSMEEDLLNLKKKVDAGADFIITQLFYDNNAFYEYMNNVARLGINIPVVPGIMPIINRKQVKKLVELSGTNIPPRLMKLLEECTSVEAEAEAGLDFSVKQCAELKSWGVKGIHIYTMNKSYAVTEIMRGLGIKGNEKK